MGRWPDNRRSGWTVVLLLFAVFPLLCGLCWWFVYR